MTGEPTVAIAILSATLVAGTPLVLTALGELVTETAGVINLGAEGTMAVAALAAFATAHHTGSAGLAILAGAVAGGAMALGFGVLTLSLNASQVASGLAVAIFGTGLADFAGKPYESVALGPVAALSWPLVHRLPVLGPILFQQPGLVPGSWVLTGAVLWFLLRTRPGLILRAVGESPGAAHALGHRVQRVRYLAVLFGGAMAGLGGAFLVLFHTPLWVEGLVAGRGWIAMALVVFASWKPLRVLAGAYLFGGAMIAQLFVQGAGLAIPVPSQVLSALPYLVTILVLALISGRRGQTRLQAPAALGQPFLPDS